MRSDLVEEEFTVVDATPHAGVVGDEIFCEFLADDPETDEVDPTTRVTFNTQGKLESVFVDVFISNESGLSFVGRRFTLSDFNFTVNVRMTTPTDLIELQFFSDFPDDLCYGSESFVCQRSGNQFVRTVCNGIGAIPNISSAIFGLNWLFASGSEPPCVAACEANGDGSVNIADMVFILNFLFSGGVAPSAWDGLDSVCELELPDNYMNANLDCPL